MLRAAVLARLSAVRLPIRYGPWCVQFLDSTGLRNSKTGVRTLIFKQDRRYISFLIENAYVSGQLFVSCGFRKLTKNHYILDK